MLVRAIFMPGNREGREIEIEEDSTGFSLLKILELSPDAHIIIRDKVPISMDEKLIRGESIGIIKVVSGG